jgi:hypothetical protein
MLAENHDPDLGKRTPKLVCEANALVCIRRRHPDVGHDDIGPDALNGRPKLVQVTAGGDEIDVLDAVENARDALACEKAVVTEDSPDQDGRTIPAEPMARKPVTCNNVVSAAAMAITSRLKHGGPRPLGSRCPDSVHQRAPARPAGAPGRRANRGDFHGVCTHDK